MWLLSVKSCLLTNNYVFYVLLDEIQVFNVWALFNLLASYDLCVKTVATCIFFFTIFWIISKLNIRLITHNHFLKMIYMFRKWSTLSWDINKIILCSFNYSTSTWDGYLGSHSKSWMWGAMPISQDTGSWMRRIINLRSLRKTLSQTPLVVSKPWFLVCSGLIRRSREVGQ